MEKNKEKKVLIIGAKGMLGRELVDLFKMDRNYKIVAWDREDIDVSREREVLSKINFIKPDIIINAAAYNAVDKCEEDKEIFNLAEKINGLAPGYLARAAQKNKAILVHYSTNYVFDGDFASLISREPTGCSHICGSCSFHQTQETGFCEEDEPNPLSKYGKTKLLGEKEVVKNLKNHYLIRLSWLFGKPALSPEAKRSFFDLMLEIGREKKEVAVIDDEVGKFTYAPDLAKKTKEIIESKKPFGIYHVANSYPTTWYEACVELYKLAKIKTKIKPVSAIDFHRSAPRPPFSVLTNTKLNPLRSWKEALKEYLESK